MRNICRDSAFTLIELLVVVAIIGILVALAFPVINSVRTSAKKAAARSDMASIETAVEMYVAEYRRMPIADVFHKGGGSWRGMSWPVHKGELFDVPGGGWHHASGNYGSGDAGRRLAMATIGTLQGSNKFEGEKTGFNPREEKFLEVQEGRPVGHFMDPWSKGFRLEDDVGNMQYGLLMDHNLNRLIYVYELARVIGESYRVEGKRVVVRCAGPDRDIEVRIDDDNLDDLYNLDIDMILKHKNK